MPRADFYILKGNQNIDQLYFVCRLVEKALRNKIRVLVWQPNSQPVLKLDELLWSYIPESFIPHAVIGQASDKQIQQAPIGLCCEASPEFKRYDMLINLRDEKPNWITQVERVAEIVIQDPQILASTRRNYAFYRSKGFEVSTHHIG